MKEKKKLSAPASVKIRISKEDLYVFSISGIRTIGGVDVNGRNIWRNELQQETTDRISKSDNGYRPPKRHCFQNPERKRAL